MLCVTVDVASAASATLTVRARVKVAVASRHAAIVTLSGGHLTVNYGPVVVAGAEAGFGESGGGEAAGDDEPRPAGEAALQVE